MPAPLSRALGLGLLLLIGCSSPPASWTDPDSGVTWARAPAGQTLPFDKAQARCEALTLDGHDDWVLPSVEAIRSLIRDCPTTVTGGACKVSSLCAEPGCFGEPCFGCAFLKGERRGCYWPDALGRDCDWVWSSTEVAGRPGFVWFADYPYGFVLPISKDYEMGAWCVRGG